LNKVDILRRGDLPPEKAEFLTKLDQQNIPIVEMSTVSQEGIMNLRDQACDALLAQRVERKLHVKGSDSGVLSRLFVAYPEPRDDKVRAAYIPETVLKKRNMMPKDVSHLRDEKTRKLEREIELEMGSKYILDLKKHYLLKNEDEKYDIVPEIWEGHNIADFVDSEIVEKFKRLKEEEKMREESGLYDSDLDTDDDETKELLIQAGQIKEKEDLMRMESKLKKGVDKPRLSRKVGRKRERTMDRLEHELGGLGVDIKSKRMRHLEEEQQREPFGKKIRVGRSPSVSAQQALPRDVQGIPDTVNRQKAVKVGRKTQKPFQSEARKGEADRRIFTLKPKHLFSGKRKGGKTDRR